MNSVRQLYDLWNQGLYTDIKHILNTITDKEISNILYLLLYSISHSILATKNSQAYKNFINKAIDILYQMQWNIMFLDAITWYLDKCNIENIERNVNDSNLTTAREIARLEDPFLIYDNMSNQMFKDKAIPLILYVSQNEYVRERFQNPKFIPDLEYLNLVKDIYTKYNEQEYVDYINELIQEEILKMPERQRIMDLERGNINVLNRYITVWNTLDLNTKKKVADSIVKNELYYTEDMMLNLEILLMIINPIYNKMVYSEKDLKAFFSTLDIIENNFVEQTHNQYPFLFKAIKDYYYYFTVERKDYIPIFPDDIIGGRISRRNTNVQELKSKIDSQEFHQLLDLLYDIYEK